MRRRNTKKARKGRDSKGRFLKGFISLVRKGREYARLDATEVKLFYMCAR